MSNYAQLHVSGVAVRPVYVRPIYVPTRKFYYPSYFHDNRHRHEIANHYRDFKMRPRIRRRKRALLQYTYRNTATSIARQQQHSENKVEVPMAKKILPRFDKTYTPRGRRTLCYEPQQQQASDLICNDTLKRIERALETEYGDTCSSSSSTALKQLAKRHLERFKGFRPNNRRTSLSKKEKQKPWLWSKSTDNVYCQQSFDKNNKVPTKVKDLPATNRPAPRNRRRSLGKLESVDWLTITRQQQLQRQQIPLNCGVIPDFVVGQEQQQSSSAFATPYEDTIALSYYLQNAADYYKRDFLDNIDYLRNVGERNQLRRKRFQQTLRQNTTTSSSTTTTTNNQYDLSSPTFTAPSTFVANNCTSSGEGISRESIQRQTSFSSFVDDDSSDNNELTVNSCNSILKNIASRHSFRIYRYNEKETEYPDFSHNSEHCPIRVQIKPSDSSSSVATQSTQSKSKGNGNDSVLSNKNSGQTAAASATTTTTAAASLSASTTKTTSNAGYSSMNDYLNGNLELQQQQAPSYFSSQLNNIHHHEYPSKHNQQKLFDFDTLISNLEDLEILESSNLPRITLTDCTEKYPSEYSTLDSTTSLLSGKEQSNLNSVLLRQASIELPASSATNNLDIPTVASDYHSDARPPQSILPN